MPDYLPGTFLALYARLKPETTLAEVRAAAQAVAVHSNEARPAAWRESHPFSTVEAIAGFARLRSQQMAAIIGFFAILMILSGLVLLIACANVGAAFAGASVVETPGNGCAPGARRQPRTPHATTAGREPVALPRWRCVRARVGARIEPVVVAVDGSHSGSHPSDSGDRLARRALRGALVGSSHSRMRITAGLAIGARVVHRRPAADNANAVAPGHRHRPGRGFDCRAFDRIPLRTKPAAVIGFEPRPHVNHTIRALVMLPPGEYKDIHKIDLYAERGVTALSSLPGVEAAAFARIVPFTDASRYSARIVLEGTNQSTQTFYYWNAVTAGYFDAMSIPVVAGRSFRPADTAAPEHPVIVSTGFVRQYLGVAPMAAVGRTFVYDNQKSKVFRIVGVAANTKNMTIGEKETPQLYEYLPNINDLRDRWQFVIRSATTPALQLNAVNEALRRVEPNAGLETKTMFSSIGFAFVPSQIGAAVLGSMGLLGLLLAMIGLYGVMAYSVERRTQEIGVRMAVGAQGSSIFKLILSDAGRMVAIGSAIGIGVALIATRPLAAFLVEGLPPHDPVTFIAVLGVFAVTAALASWGPARRATAIDPMYCLRHD